MLYESDNRNFSQDGDDEDAFLKGIELAFNQGFDMFKYKFDSLSDDQVSELCNLLGDYNNT